MWPCPRHLLPSHTGPGPKILGCLESRNQTAICIALPARPGRLRARTASSSREGYSDHRRCPRSPGSETRDPNKARWWEPGHRPPVVKILDRESQRRHPDVVGVVSSEVFGGAEALNEYTQIRTDRCLPALRQCALV